MTRTKEAIINEILDNFDFASVERIRDLELLMHNTGSRLTVEEMRFEARELLEDVLSGGVACNPISSFGFQAFRAGTEVVLQYVVTDASSEIYTTPKNDM